MTKSALLELADRIAADEEISADEALELRRVIFPDGVVTREEAEVMIALEGRVANSDEAFAHAFVEAIVDHALQSGPYPGHIDEAKADWLIAQFGAVGARETELEVVLKCVERSESAPESLCAFARDRVAVFVAGKPMGQVETELVRRALYCATGSGATSVTETEARWMFALDAACEGLDNDPAWGDLFVKSVLNHLMGRRAPALLDAKDMIARQAWLRAPSRGVAGFIRAMFDPNGRAEKLSYDAAASPAAHWERHYERVNAERVEDERLTLIESAWALGMTKEDDKLTANEKVLLAEIREIEAAQVA